MPKIELMIRKLETGELLNAEFQNENECEQWLVERPNLIEVVKMVSKVEPELEAHLRQKMRPLDFGELARRDELAKAQRMEIRAQRAQEEAEAKADEESAEEPTGVDPNRAMVVRWGKAQGFYLADEHDEREVPQRVKDAITAWIDERNGWVRDRGQHVSAAIVTVSPAADADDLIHPGGQFVTSDNSAEEN